VHGQIRFLDVRVRPDPLVNFFFLENARALGDQQPQKIDRFRGEVNGDTAFRKLSPIGIETEIAEMEPHGPRTVVELSQIAATASPPIVPLRDVHH
jgi:hypothetical protein